MFILEALKIIFQSMKSFVRGVLPALIDVTLTFFELEKISSAFTPTTTDIIAYCLGIPVALVSAIIILVKVAKIIYRVRSKIEVDSYEEI